MSDPVNDLKNSLHYLDASDERASATILREMGVSWSPKLSKAAFASLSKRELDFLGGASTLEHQNTSETYVFVESGWAFVDMRDSGDCLVRCMLRATQVGLLIPANLSYRILPHAEHGKVIVHEFSESGVQRMDRFANDADSRVNEALPYHTTRELVCDLCRVFFTAGWVTGTGGSISIRHGDRIYMTPSGVQKERISPDELFVLDVDGNILATPKRKPRFTPKLSDCSPLFLHAFKQRNAGAVLHSHAVSSNLITSICEGQNAFRISHQEMIKGLAGHGYFDELSIPIIENTAHEHELADALGECIANNPKTSAVLVRRHGIYVWGKSWEEAKRHSECIHYLFDVALNMHKMGLDFNSPPAPVSITSSKQVNPSSCTHVIFDIEGTTTPISFVKDILFPYSRDHAEEFLRKQGENDPLVSALRSLTRPNASISEIAELVSKLVGEDSKETAIKTLQGHMWKEAYESGKIKAPLYADVPHCFSRLFHAGKKVSIYSSGSRQAQRLLFKHSDRGDVREFINCYFDTTTGPKREKQSYTDILLSLGVDVQSDVLFVTDVYEEALAANSAGMQVVLVMRPNNAPLSSDNMFATIDNFDVL
eukprot:GSChrysophyteH2.ASY1.ANO1.287.1 assembled CDS